MDKILDMLAEREQETFYAYTHTHTEEAKEAHDIAKANFILYAKEHGIL